MRPEARAGSAGTSIPLGQGDLLAQIAYTRSTGPAVNRKHTTTSLGYVYHYNSVADIYLLSATT